MTLRIRLFTWILLGTLIAPGTAAEWQLDLHESGAMASFRGIAAGDMGTVWVGGSQATLIESRDHGKTWRTHRLNVPETSEFRDIEVTGKRSLVVMSAGTGPKSRVLRTSDGGRRWQTVLENPDPQGFFNGMALAPEGFGALVGDPIDGRLTVFVTRNGGRDWQRISGPQVSPNEYGFAASGTGVVVNRGGGIGIVTGGSRCRYYHRAASSRPWTTSELGMRQGTQSAGAFSVAFAGRSGVAVGGDYLKPELGEKNVAITRDHGKTWTVPQVVMPHKACVLALGGDRFLTCGRTGISLSEDAGNTWKPLSKESFYTMTLGRDADEPKPPRIWLAGAEGRVAQLRPPAARKE